MFQHLDYNHWGVKLWPVHWLHIKTVAWLYLRSKQSGTVFQQVAVLKINTFSFQCGSNVQLLIEFVTAKECYYWDEERFNMQVWKKTVYMCKEQVNITVMSVGTITIRLPTYECLLSLSLQFAFISYCSSKVCEQFLRPHTRHSCLQHHCLKCKYKINLMCIYNDIIKRYCLYI